MKMPTRDELRLNELASTARTLAIESMHERVKCRWLTVHREDEFGALAWKGHDWETLNRLHEKELVGDPVSKAKSVILTPEGLARGQMLFEQLFAKTS